MIYNKSSFFAPFSLYMLIEIYHQQQNKWYPQMFLVHYEAILHFILAVPNSLAH